jgi:hypothetical protein
MAKRARAEQETGGAYHRIDDETGMPYWELWGVDWKDSESMSVGAAMELLPTAFPPGTRIVVIEPHMDDPRSKAYYAAEPNPLDFYPCDYDKHGESNDPH